MAPKEKAIELYKNIFKITESQYESKQCTLIAVDEIINYLISNEITGTLMSYWEEVKQEIEKL